MKFSRRTVFTLAAKIRVNLNLSQSAATKIAWASVKKYQLKVISFTKKSGEVTKRVVSFDWLAFNTLKGTRQKPEGLNIFTDFVKVLSGAKHHTISCYQYDVL